MRVKIDPKYHEILGELKKNRLALDALTKEQRDAAVQALRLGVLCVLNPDMSASPVTDKAILSAGCIYFVAPDAVFDTQDTCQVIYEDDSVIFDLADVHHIEKHSKALTVILVTSEWSYAQAAWKLAVHIGEKNVEAFLTKYRTYIKDIYSK